LTEIFRLEETLHFFQDLKEITQGRGIPNKELGLLGVHVTCLYETFKRKQFAELLRWYDLPHPGLALPVKRKNHHFFNGLADDANE